LSAARWHIVWFDLFLPRPLRSLHAGYPWAGLYNYVNSQGYLLNNQAPSLPWALMVIYWDSFGILKSCSMRKSLICGEGGVQGSGQIDFIWKGHTLKVLTICWTCVQRIQLHKDTPQCNSQQLSPAWPFSTIESLWNGSLQSCYTAWPQAGR
jgi:hypothetical protein